jgi:hypothetical protein
MIAAAYTLPPTDAPIHTVSIYNRRAMGWLWDHRATLSPKVSATLSFMYDNKKKGDLQCRFPNTYKLKPEALGFGRFYSNKGPETLEKEIRATLFHEYYWDVDIANCHPTLLVQFAKRYFSMDLSEIRNYVENREEFLAKFPSRQEGKDAFIKIIYGGSADLPELQKMSQQVEQFCNLLKQQEIFAPLLQYCRNKVKNDNRTATKKKTLNGCFLSHIIQAEERRCLMVVLLYLSRHGYSVDVLAYDGMMVRKDNKEMPSLEGMAAAVEEETGYTLTFTEKPMEGIAILDEDIPYPVEETNYDEIKASFEETIFHYRPNNTIMQIKGDTIHRWSTADAKQVLNTILVTVQKINSDGKMVEERVPFINKWLTDSDRRMVDHLVYKFPEDVLPGEATIFTGFGFEKLDTGDLDPAPYAIPLFEDILSSVCGDEKHVADYVRNTLAHIIQKPFEINGVCTIFSSQVQGTGKDTFMGIARRIVGNHTAHYTDDDQFWSQYDTLKEGALIIHLEEAGGFANKKKSGALKARITSESMVINPKMVGAYNMPSYARYFMTTNEAEPVKFETSDRRFLLINPSTRLVKADWTSIYSQISRPEFTVAIGKYLQGVNIAGWLPRSIPETAIRREMVNLSMEQEESFLCYWRDNTDLPAEMTSSELFNAYRSWATDGGIEHKLTLVGLGRKIARHLGSYCTKHEGRGRVAVYTRMG